VPWLRRLVAGLSPRRSRFAPESVHVGFVVGKVALGLFFEFFGFPLSVSFHRGSPYTYICGMDDRPFGGRSSETQSYTIDMNNNNIDALTLHMLHRFHSFIFPLGFQLEHRAPLGVSVIAHTSRHTVGLLWTSDQPVAENSTYTRQHNI
jgi:hypothetical protein